jgi:hypothetical protein
MILFDRPFFARPLSTRIPTRVAQMHTQLLYILFGRALCGIGAACGPIGYAHIARYAFSLVVNTDGIFRVLLARFFSACMLLFFCLPVWISRPTYILTLPIPTSPPSSILQRTQFTQHERPIPPQLASRRLPCDRHYRECRCAGTGRPVCGHQSAGRRADATGAGECVVVRRGMGVTRDTGLHAICFFCALFVECR